MQYYINAESVSPDGLTPATGYHNFTDLLTAIGALTGADFVDVVKTATPVSQSLNGILAGTIRPQVMGTLPVIELGGGNGLVLKSNTLIKGLYFTHAFGGTILFRTGNAGLGGDNPAENITIDSCQFVATINNGSSAPMLCRFGDLQYNQDYDCTGFTMQNCTLWRFNSINVESAAWASGQKFVFVNNDWIIQYYAGADYYGLCTTTNLEVFAYNNTFKQLATDGVSLTPYSFTGAIFRVAESGGTIDHGEVDYNYCNTGIGTVGDGHVTVGSHNVSNCADMYTAGFGYPAGDAYWSKLFNIGSPDLGFQLAGTSLLIGVGTSNTYTPLVDILGNSRAGSNDVGAYEFVAPIPTRGDRYIAKVTAHGWIQDHVYEYNGVTWDDVTPAEGMTLYNKDNKKYLVWTPFGWDYPLISTRPAEIVNLPTSCTPDAADVVITEDVSDGSNKKKLTLGNLVNTVPPQAHDLAGTKHNADTIAHLQSKVSDGVLITTARNEYVNACVQATPDGNAEVLLEEGISGNHVKIRSTLTNIFNTTPPASHALAGSIHTTDTITNLQTKLTDGSLITTKPAEISALSNKCTPAGADLAIIEDSADTNKKKNITLASLNQVLNGTVAPSQHGIASSTYHSSAATSGKMLKADANGLPVNASNTDTEVSGAVSASHAKQHAITATADHTSSATSGKMLKADANGLPVDASNTDTAVAAAVSASHARQHGIATAADHNADSIANFNAMLNDGDMITTHAGEFAALPHKSVMAGNDAFLLEDAADGVKKKYILASDLLSQSFPPTAHDLAGALHNADTITNLNLKLSDGDVLSTKAGEISALTNKCTPTTADLLLIEDAADTNKKKNILISALPAATPAAHDFGGALHTADTIAHIQSRLSSGNFFTSAAGEISGTTAKTTAVAADLLLIEDSAAANAKKKLTVDGLIVALRRYYFPVDCLMSPVNADWKINALASVTVDATANSVLVRDFTHAAELGAGAEFAIPANATNIIFKAIGKAAATPGANLKVALKVYARDMGSGAAMGAWSAGTAWNITLVNNVYFQEFTTTISLATLGLTADNIAMIELTRNGPDGTNDTLTADWLLKGLRVYFS